LSIFQYQLRTFLEKRAIFPVFHCKYQRQARPVTLTKKLAKMGVNCNNLCKTCRFCPNLTVLMACFVKRLGNFFKIYQKILKNGGILGFLAVKWDK